MVRQSRRCQYLVICDLVYYHLRQLVTRLAGGSSLFSCGCIASGTYYSFTYLCYLKFPLLWSLHLAYWFIAIGFFLLAVNYFNGSVSFSTALHALTVGAIGGMII